MLILHGDKLNNNRNVTNEKTFKFTFASMLHHNCECTDVRAGEVRITT